MDLKEEFAGEVAVDAAIIMIGDPYYSLCNKVPEFGKDWSEFCNIIGDEDVIQIGRATAVVVGGFGGDGVYPVYVRKDKRGRVVEAVVRFRE